MDHIHHVTKHLPTDIDVAKKLIRCSILASVRGNLTVMEYKLSFPPFNIFQVTFGVSNCDIRAT